MGGVKGGLQGKYSLPCCCIRGSIEFEMQHEHVLKKLNFDLFTPWVGDGGLRTKYLLQCFFNGDSI